MAGTVCPSRCSPEVNGHSVCPTLPAIAGRVCAPAGVLRAGGSARGRTSPGGLLLPQCRLPRALLLLLARPLKVLQVDLVIDLQQNRSPFLESWPLPSHRDVDVRMQSSKRIFCSSPLQEAGAQPAWCWGISKLQRSEAMDWEVHQVWLTMVAWTCQSRADLTREDLNEENYDDLG